ncbi:MAG: GAF domain-containing protein [Verrucomicrobia bacterium]|nr:GAF domain-containing protein [Verrucomicrobiota bacterium]
MNSHRLEISPEDLLDSKRLGRRVLAEVQRRFAAERGGLFLLNPNLRDLEVEAAAGLSAKSRKRRWVLGQGLIGWVASRGLAARADVKTMRSALGPGGSEMAAPLSDGDKLIGVLAVGTRRKNHFQEGQEKELADLARQAGEWMALAWRVAGTREEGERSAALAEVGAAVGAEETVPAILQRVARESQRMCGAQIASIFLLDPQREELRLEICLGGTRRYREQTPLPVSETALGYVVRRQRPFTLPKIEEGSLDLHTERISAEGVSSLAAVPLGDPRAGVGVLCVAAAALGRAKLASRLDQTEEELRNRERLSSLGMLAAEVAHEVRNPLAVVRMLWHSAVRGLPVSGEQAQDLERIEAKLGQMNTILDRILNLARSADPEMQDLDAAELAEEVMLLTRTKLSTARILPDLKVPSRGVARIRGDRSLLEQALLNLVLNAVEAMPGGGNLRIEVKKDPRGVMLSVQDQGPGMKKEVAERLFEPFLTRRPGGTGLGLALVRRTVEVHGGSVRVQSRPGKGTRVEIRLPRPVPV